MQLDLWARKWDIESAAIAELRQIYGMECTGIAPTDSVQSESEIQSLIRLEASQLGMRLWRNNVGAFKTPEGSFVRYGLSNESSNVNRMIKSADLIGIKPVLITVDHVGCVLGQFVSREVKASNWKYAGTEREEAQLRWAELILSLGGDACFVNRRGTL